MKGDFTRTTFNRAKHYSSVRAQQNHVQLDADWNEQVDIQTHRRQTELRDVVGACGVSQVANGFKVSPSVNLLDVFPFDSQGWVVGGRATILTTNDGGQSWTRQTAPAATTADLRGVYFVDPSRGWAVGDAATILTSEDGGQTWQVQTPPAGVVAHLRAVRFAQADESRGWAVGDSATILTTIDAGGTWVKQQAPSGVASRLRAIHFAMSGEDRGWAVGDNATILTTQDGGETWETQEAPAGVVAHLRAVHFAAFDESRGWAVGNNATILNTVDGGQTWETQQPPADVVSHLRAVHFATIDEDRGWAVGDDATMLSTVDGGQTWTRQETPRGVVSSLRAVHFADENRGWAVGDDATILSTDDGGNTWRTETTPSVLPSLSLSPGSIQVDGLHCDQSKGVLLTQQQDLPADTLADLVRPAAQPLNPGAYLAYLDVWQRHLSAVDDQSIREVALRGPDTATRTKTICQVKLLPVGDADSNVFPDCSSVLDEWNAHIAESTGRLTARITPGGVSDDPCELPAEGGYRGLENQLYRVEIHQGGPLDTATFKWSRENGSIVTRWLGQDVNDLTVGTLGRDPVLNFADHWVELIDDTRELWGEPGSLVKLAQADDRILEIDPASSLLFAIKLNVSARVQELDEARVTVALRNEFANSGISLSERATVTINQTSQNWSVRDHVQVFEIAKVNNTNLSVSASVNRDHFPLNPKVRRWDMPEGVISATIPASNDGFVELEAGVEIRFEPGTYRTGDYWLIPARAGTRELLWPRDQRTQRPTPQSPHGIEHHYCRLAMLRFDGVNSAGWSLLDDCRCQYVPQTSLRQLFCVGGDGQEAMPGQFLCGPLVVRARSGSSAQDSVTVQFEIVDPTSGGASGTLTRTDGTAGPLDHVLQVETDNDGLAACRWQLDASDPPVGCQQVTATLLDSNGRPLEPPLRFRASLSLAAEVESTPPADCERLAGAETVQQALDFICEGTATRISDVTLGAAGPPLLNDDSARVEQLRDDGIRLVCDRPLDPQPIKRATSFVTVEVPVGVGTPDELAAYRPRVLAADLTQSGPDIVWMLTADSATWLEQRLSEAQITFNQSALLARLNVQGNFIWGTDDPPPYLDGDTFGAPADARADLTPEGLPPTRLRVLDGRRLSGDGRRGGDFEMWFWVVPPPNRAPTANDATLSVAENTANGAAVGTVVATDPDFADVLTYGITGGNASSAFAIDGSTGQITVNDSAALDFETTPTFVLTVQVTDLGGLSDTATITINLVDVNEPPMANDDTFNINEHAPVGTPVGTVAASDLDVGDVLTYAIIAGNVGNAFAIDGSTGQIAVNDSAALDFETTPIFNLTVRVTDLGGLSDTATITINLADVNEPPNAFNASFDLLQNSPNGTVVGAVVATDPDGDDLSFAIVGGNRGNAFAINSSTGVITVANSAAISPPGFTLVFRATDSGGLADTAAARINILQVATFDACIDDLRVLVGGSQVFLDDFESVAEGDPPAADVGTWNDPSGNAIVSSGDPNRVGQYGCLQRRNQLVVAEFDDIFSANVVVIRFFFRVSPTAILLMRLHGASLSEIVFQLELDGESDEYRVIVQNAPFFVRGFAFADTWHELAIQYRPFDNELRLTLDAEFDRLVDLNVPQFEAFTSVSFQMRGLIGQPIDNPLDDLLGGDPTRGGLGGGIIRG